MSVEGVDIGASSSGTSEAPESSSEPRPEGTGLPFGALTEEVRFDQMSKGSPLARPPGWPPGWERFRCLGLLGSGGMGQVFEAWDPGLRRPVAVKLLRSEDPELVQRFVREAQAQARVDHPHVCKVFEVGEVAGRPFIAMQVVHGEPLSLASTHLSIEQKALLVRQVAEALHAAHKLGLVHRDLKPGNIMVERAEDGSLHPYVVDFGLVRELGAETLTLEGSAIGTPSFMAPEQAAGETARIDRRTDVYALGATLYAALAGQPPFAGSSAVEVLRRVLDEEPSPLGAVVPGVPADLATIVMKCLEKDPVHRYDSARALASDLGRFLDGEPIAARPASLIYRLGKRVRRNRLSFGLGVAAALATLVLGGAWLLERRDAARRAAVAQRFGQRVERAESTLWKAMSLAPHDINPDREALRRAVRSIETEMHSLGGTGLGPGHASIGRCYLALQEPRQARFHLETAWRMGFRSQEVAHDLSTALVSLYEQGLQELWQLPDPKQREARKVQLDAELSVPARRLLSEYPPQDAGERLFSQAVICFLEGRHEDALGKARDASVAVPWRYEAWLLAGAATLGLGRTLESGGRYEEFFQALEQADMAYRRAADVAPSDPRVWGGMCEVRRESLSVHVWWVGDATQHHLAGVREACEKAIEVDPTAIAPRLALADGHASWAELLLRRGEDTRPALTTAIEHSDEVLANFPDHPEALGRRAIARWQLGKQQFEKGENPLVAYELGLADIRKAVAAQPGSFSHCLDHGLVALDLGVYQLYHDGDPTAALSEAIEAFTRAHEIDRTRAGPLVNTAGALSVLLDWEVGTGSGSPLQTATRAFEALAAAEALNPRMHWVPRTEASVHIALGRLARQQGSDPRPHLDRSVAASQVAIARDRTDPTSFNYLAVALLERAEFEIDSGLSPRDTLCRADKAIADGLGINPSYSGLLVERENAEKLRARWRAPRRP